MSRIALYEILIKRELTFAKNLLFIKEKDGFNELYFWTPSHFKEILEKDLDNLKEEDSSFVPPKILEVNYGAL